MLIYLQAAEVKRGDIIKTRATASDPPTTMHVIDGGFVDVDERGKWLAPRDPEHPTHVYLDGWDGEEIVLPTAERVLVQRTIHHPSCPQRRDVEAECICPKEG